MYVKPQFVYQFYVKCRFSSWLLKYKWYSSQSFVTMLHFNMKSEIQSSMEKDYNQNRNKEKKNTQKLKIYEDIKKYGLFSTLIYI